MTQGKTDRGTQMTHIFVCVIQAKVSLCPASILRYAQGFKSQSNMTTGAAIFEGSGG